MFGRPKKPDGFEWHKYIRTSIRLRRERRRERVLDARRAAAEQAHAAGAALAQGSRAAGAALAQGSRAAGAAAWAGALSGLGTAWLVAQAAGELAWSAALAARRRLAIWAQPLTVWLARPNIGGPIALAGAIALGTGIGRARGAGLDGEVLITLTIGFVLLAASLPLLSSLIGLRMPSLARLGVSPRTACIGVAVAAIAMAACLGRHRRPGPSCRTSAAGKSGRRGRCRAAPRRSPAISCASPAPPCASPASRRRSASRPAAPAAGATLAARQRRQLSRGSSTAAR